MLYPYKITIIPVVSIFFSIISNFGKPQGNLEVTGQLAPAVAFGFEHPQFMLDSALLSGSAVASQFLGCC